MIVISVLFMFISCQQGDKNFDGIAKNYTPVVADTNCLNAGSNAYFELKEKNFDTLILAIKTKLRSVLGEQIFGEEETNIMSDSIKQAVFDLEPAFASNEIQIDTTNLLLLKEDFDYYMNNMLTPRENLNWRHYFTPSGQYVLQQNENVEIRYTLVPCIKRIIGQEGQFKRIRRRNAMPGYLKNSDAHVDRVNIYDCMLNISVLIQVTDKSVSEDPRPQYYEVIITDTAKVFTTMDMMDPK